MDLQKKLGYAQMHVDSIATHRDVDASVRKAAIGRVMSMCSNALSNIDAEVAEQIKELDAKPAPDPEPAN